MNYFDHMRTALVMMTDGTLRGVGNTTTQIYALTLEAKKKAGTYVFVHGHDGDRIYPVEEIMKYANSGDILQKEVCVESHDEVGWRRYQTYRTFHFVNDNGEASRIILINKDRVRHLRGYRIEGYVIDQSANVSGIVMDEYVLCPSKMVEVFYKTYEEATKLIRGY